VRKLNVEDSGGARSASVVYLNNNSHERLTYRKHIGHYSVLNNQGLILPDADPMDVLKQCTKGSMIYSFQTKYLYTIETNYFTFVKQWIFSSSSFFSTRKTKRSNI
jgi:hypothetical protein